MKERLQKTEFESSTCPPPIAAVSPVPFRKVIHEFHSMKRFEEDIMRILEGRDADMVGIWGIGGVGKTIIAQKILNRALEEGLFDEVVMVTVSQPVDKLVIQMNIAEQLGLTLMGEAFKPRADILRRRLWVKRRLILLDDVCEVLNLEELGIPCNLECCTIILTSRHKDVLKGMEVENACELGVLDEDEAWDFFKKMAGTCVDDAILEPIPFEVMKECKGLLIALESVGKAHEDEESREIWTDSLDQLRKNNPVDIPNVIEEVYRPLRLSYDRLESGNAKSTFLLCCLFAEDAYIPLEHLTYFAMGLGLFNNTWELEGVRGMICKSIDKLKNCCLLLEGRDADHVRMHDVVRDVSIFIASEERRVKCNDCTWISSHVFGGARPPMCCFPKLKLLVMNNKDGDQEIEINNGNLIGGSTELNVLFIDYSLMKSLPALKMSLTTLILRNCKSLESISVVGQLESLEILVCDSCPLLKELPVQEVKWLKHLKLLEISHCFSIERVAAGVISSLVGLEELKIMGCFNDWKGKEAMEDASLREIESLKQLRRLNIRVYDIALAAQPLRLPSKLVQFTVRFGEYFYFDDGLSTSSYQRKMCLDFGREDDINWGDLSTNIFMSHTEYLYAHGVGQVFNLNLASAPRIRWLTLEGFGNEKNIISTVAAFPLLESLSVMYLNKLEEIWDDAPIPSDSFNSLRELRLVGLHRLKRMGKSVLSAANDLFPQLETIAIQECDEIEHLILLVPNVEEHQHERNHISTELIFPKLKVFDLYALSKFRSMICSRGIEIESIQFPLLAEMQILGCDNLKWFVSRDDEEEDHDSLHMFCNPKVSFGNLEKLALRGSVKSKNVWCGKVPMGFFTRLVKLEIESHGKIKRLFSSSSKIPQNLVNLQKLVVRYCDNMVKVIEEDDEEVSSCDHPTILFPSLQEIKLLQLRKLESFCEWRCALELPSLKKLHIRYCEGMKSFNAAAGSLVITPALQAVRIDQYLECVDDLNAALHQHFDKAKREQKEGRRRRNR